MDLRHEVSFCPSILGPKLGHSQRQLWPISPGSNLNCHLLNLKGRKWEFGGEGVSCSSFGELIEIQNNSSNNNKTNKQDKANKQ